MVRKSTPSFTSIIRPGYSVHAFNCVLLLFIGIFLFSFYSFSQAKNVFCRLSTDDGLTTNDIKCTIQDKKGFIWIGTSNGLQRFDGNKFINPICNNKNKQIPAIGIRQIVIDKFGRFIMLQANDKIGMFDPLTFEYEPIKIKAEKEVPINSDYTFYVDRKGNVFLCGSTYGILIFDLLDDSFTDKNLPVSIPDNWGVNSLCEDPVSGYYWIISDEGLAVYDPFKKKVYNKSHNPLHIKLLNVSHHYVTMLVDEKQRFWISYYDKEFYNQQILCYNGTNDKIEERPEGTIVENFAEFTYMHQTKNGKIWLGGQGALLSLEQNSNIFLQNKNDNIENYGVELAKVNNLFEDKENNLWVSSNKGIYILYSKSEFIPAYQFHEKTDILVFSFIPFKSNEFWIAGMGKGITILDSLFVPFKECQFKDYPQVWSIFLKSDSRTILAGSGEGKVLVIDALSKKVKEVIQPKLFKKQEIMQIAEDHNGEIWFALSNGKIIKKTNTESYDDSCFSSVMDLNSVVRKLFVDKQNNLWICTTGKGLFKYNKSNKKIIQFNENSKPFPLVGNTVLSVTQYNDSIYFIGGEGLNILNVRSGFIKKLSVFDGLPNNYIYSLDIDMNNLLWMATLSGLCNYNYTTGRFTTFNKSDGLLNSENMLSAFVSPNGKLFVGGVNFASYMNPSQLTKSFIPPEVTITGIELLNRNLNVDSFLNIEKVNLSYIQNTFTISFSSLTYLQKNRLTYYYMLEGVDKGWIQSDKSHSVNYTLLPPGKYTFKVRCQNDQGIYCKSITCFPIIINSPYWQTWWFRSIYFSLIVALALFIYKLRIRQLMAIEKIRHRVARDLHDDMGSTLSTINILSMMAKNKIKVDQVKASEYIGKITDNSSRMMESMDDIIWNINPANDDMNKIIARMREFATNCIESKDITLDFSIEPLIEDIHLDTEQRRDLFLIFKEAVNNVAKYAQCNSLQISLGYNDKKFYLSIIDNGIGFYINESDNGLGIKNMQRRAYNLKGELTIKSVISSGTSIYFNFPI